MANEALGETLSGTGERYFVAVGVDTTLLARGASRRWRRAFGAEKPVRCVRAFISPPGKRSATGNRSTLQKFPIRENERHIICTSGKPRVRCQFAQRAQHGSTKPL